MSTAQNMGFGKSALLAIAAAMVLMNAGVASADTYKLPDAAEIATLSPDALKFYSAGIAALDRIDYMNAYSNLSKAAMLQPGAVLLNNLAAGLALKHGRGKPAAEARGYYETAIYCLQDVLRNPTLDEDFRRNSENTLRIAVDERENLDQRDAKRESLGQVIIMELNRKGITPTPGTEAPAYANPAGPGAPGAPGVPGAPGAAYAPLQPGVNAGVATPIVPGASNTPALPGVISTPPPSPDAPLPGLPAPGAPGALPSLPGAAPTPV